MEIFGNYNNNGNNNPRYNNYRSISNTYGNNKQFKLFKDNADKKDNNHEHNLPSDLNDDIEDNDEQNDHDNNKD